MKSMSTRQEPMMRIQEDQLSREALEEWGAVATALLCSGDIPTLAAQFGYALAHGLDPASAIREDLSSSLARLEASALGHPQSVVSRVDYFKPNDTGLYALVEQRIPTDNGRQLLLELIVTFDGTIGTLGLEQISAEA